MRQTPEIAHKQFSRKSVPSGLVRSFAAHIAALFTLVAFLVTTSGWVLHRHYCPESEQQVISLLDARVCSEPMAKEPTSCCEKPVALPVALPEPACGSDDGCCKDQVILLELPSPYTLPVYQNGEFLTAVAVQAPFRAEIALWVVLPEAELPAQPIPPPPRRCLDRLNELQVYRT